MCARSGFCKRRPVRVLGAILAVLVMNLTVGAGTMTIVNLPATGTDAAIGISTTKTYTHAFDFGSNAPATINGVALERGPTANITAVYTRTSAQGFGYTITDTRSSISIATHAGNDPAGQVDGNSAGLFRDMIYHSGSTTLGAGAVLTLSNLTPGATYSFRWYYRAWGAATPNRTITVQADGGHNGTFSDVLDVSSDGGGAHYLDYTYTCDDTNVTLRFLTTYNNNGVHLYGITNELLRGPNSAFGPSPADKATDIYREPALAWKAGETAGAHDVYFGTSFVDVNTATVAAPLGVLASASQKTTEFAPGRLELGKTYYWRVDEVNATPDHTVFRGGVWSFTVEPVSYPIGKASIAATASSVSLPTMGPEKTADGSGLNAGDEHSTTGEQMWLSAKDDPKPWVQYAFDKTYKLDRLLVWNSNQPIETMIGFGARAVKVEYSTDGTTWATLGDVEFAQANGLATYTTNTTVNFAGAAAKYVKLSISSNWGGLVTQYGLSEVRFYQIPAGATYPNPVSGTTGLDPQVTLSWRPGRGAASHQVFLGTDAANLTLAGTATKTTYTMDVELGRTYYWKVVEVNETATPSSWESPVWSFATVKGVAVDDFDSYNDFEGKGTRIYETWIDGFDNPKANGAVVGNSQSPFAEIYLFFGGKQSMPLTYANTAGAAYSETERVFDAPQDWTKYGCKSLVLYFFGDPNNTGQLYLKINGTKVLYSGAADDLTIRAWLPWAVDLASVNTNLQKVTKLAIGVEGAGAKGKLLIDDVRLYPAPAASVTPADPGTTGLIAHYKLDGDAKDAVGGHDGTATGSPQFVAGKVGQAMNIQADSQYITVPYATDLSMNSFTVAAWVRYADKSVWRGFIGTRFSGENTFDLKANAAMIHGDIGNGTAWLNTAVDITTPRGGNITMGAWHHIAYAIDDTTDTAKLYLDGALAATATFTGTPLFMKSGQQLRIGVSYGTEYMRGAVDDVRLYNRALSEAEAAALAARPGPVFKAP